jgi:hypothetical protein
MSIQTADTYVMSSNDYSKCDESKDYIIEVLEISMDYDSLNAGESIRITAAVEFSERERIQWAKYFIYFNVYETHKGKYDISGTYEDGETYYFYYNFEIPSAISSGTYLLRISVDNVHDELLGCWEAEKELNL